MSCITLCELMTVWLRDGDTPSVFNGCYAEETNDREGLIMTVDEIKGGYRSENYIVYYYEIEEGDE